MIRYPKFALAFRLGGIFLLALVYFVTARLGLSLGAVNTFATLVWPPTGISLAALLIFGGQLWPGVFLGAFFANYATGASIPVAFGIGTGNTLEAVVGYLFLRQLTAHLLLDRFQSVTRFIFLSSFVSTLISATIGVTCLYFSGTIGFDGIGITWRAWWLGDVMGNLLLVPFIVAWVEKETSAFKMKQAFQVIFTLAVVLGTSALVLTDWINAGSTNFPHPYLLFPVVMFVALRFDKKTVTLMSLAVAVIAIASTSTGHGRFISGSLSEELILTQIFLGVLTISQLLLVSIVIERRKESEALLSSNAHREAILNASLDSIITIDHHGNIIEFNPSAEKTFGYAFNDVQGRPLEEIIIPPHLREAHRKGMKHFLASGEGPVLGKRIELPAIKSDGTEFPVEISIQPLQIDGAHLFTGFIQDISERKFAEKERKEQEKKLSAQYGVMSALSASGKIQEVAEQILSVIGINMGWDVGAIWMVNDAETLLEPIEVWCAAEINPLAFIKATRERRFQRGLGLPGRVWQTQEPAWIQDVTLDKNFPRAPIAETEGLHAAFGFPIRSGTKVFGVIEFFSSEIRTPHPELLRTVATIGGQIGQFLDRAQTAEALRVALQAREADLKLLRLERELRERFVATLTHDLRNPLAAALMGAHVLQRTKEPTDVTQRIARQVSSSIERADRMIQDLLDANLVRAGQKLPLQLASCDLNQIIADSIEELALTHGDRFRFVGPDHAQGFWSQIYLRRVIDNLMVNAVKYGDPKQSITVRVEPQGDHVRFSVHNFGTPIPRGDLETVFEPFLRTDSAQSGAQKGWGLGLTLVRGIAEAHGGRVWTASDETAGTTFTVELPKDSRK